MSEGARTTIAAGVAMGLATMFVALRFYVRVRIKKDVEWNDWVLLIGVSVDPDADKDIRDAIDEHTGLDIDPHTTYLKLSFVCSILYFQVVTTIKVSILLMHRRVFRIDPSFQRRSLIVGVIVFAFWLATTVATLINCRTLKYNWLGLSPQEHCINFNVFWMAAGAAEVIIHTIILALPISMAFDPKLSRQTKALIISNGFMGSIVIITGIVRVVRGYVPGSRVPSYSGSGLWSAIHVGTAIVCACLPTLRPLWKYERDNIITYVGQDHSYSEDRPLKTRKILHLRDSHAKAASLARELKH